jgi:hypothetical protein
MIFFLDAEYNGFGGKLISMALVPEDRNISYFYCEVEMTDILDPWVRQNVVPKLVGPQNTYSDFQKQLRNYLVDLREPITIIADWPEDVQHFCEALIVGPGLRMPSSNITFMLDFGIRYKSNVPHNALHDAIAIKTFFIPESSQEV